MKTIFQHIEYVKGKPHHVRKQVAFATAAGVTAVVALVWFFSTLSAGTFAIQGSTFADSTSEASTTTNSVQSNSGIAGAAAAVQDENAPAHIEIVDTSTSTTPAKQQEQTVIPF